MTTQELPNYAISVRQPWAWALIYGGKDVENRVKRAITLGRIDQHKRLAIHASRGMTRSEYESAASFMDTIGVHAPRPDQLERGSIIGSVHVTGITKSSDSPWFFGPWALCVTNAEACDPIPVSGQLGAFKWKRDDNAFLEPSPWMRRWPHVGHPNLRPVELPLFATEAPMDPS